jgi:hypothetical protein
MTRLAEQFIGPEHISEGDTAVTGLAITYRAFPAGEAYSFKRKSRDTEISRHKFIV